MDIRAAIGKVISRQDLTGPEMQSVIRDIMQGAASPAQIGGFLIGLRMKGETVTEITAAATVMRELAARVEIKHPHLVDIVGTGGDASHTFNISTTAAFVVAAAGGKVAKHNNRSVSSKSGSADVLEAAGVKLDLTPAQVRACIDKVGVGFMFAPMHHSAMKHTIGPRKELATRTIFNLLGPLTNPAEAPNELMGVFSKDLVLPMAQVLQQLGARHVMVVHAEDGLDEISIAAATQVAELKDGAITTYHITPEQFGFGRSKLTEIQVTDAGTSLQLMQQVLDNRPGPARDIVLLNAGAAIYVAGVTGDLQHGIELAGQVLADGSARQKLHDLIQFARQIAA
ncbi:MAG: anthranilate phosphoribosyltransferase [Gammaproteobacteria bacterium]|nr:anthranilate phosphoribosyltransferase [Gammaproteobacteria bacterium]